MSALDRLMSAASNGAAPSESSQTSGDIASKVEKRFSELKRRREKALKDTKGTARWWKFFTIVCTRDKDTDDMTAVHLQCSLCNTKLSATNESRIASSHLKNAACSKVKTDPETAAVVAQAFIKSAVSASDQHDPDEQEALAQLQNKKRKASSQSSVADVFLSKEKQEAYTMALYDFFLENSDCVAMHACEPHAGVLLGTLERWQLSIARFASESLQNCATWYIRRICIWLQAYTPCIRCISSFWP